MAGELVSFVAGELVSFGIQKLWNLLSQECGTFQGVEDQVTGLKRDLNYLICFLKDADAKQHTSAVVKYCVEEIHEFVYDAEDIIETYLLNEKLGKTSGGTHACIIPDRRRYALDIERIRTRISGVVRDIQRCGVEQAIVDGGYLQPQGDSKRISGVIRDMQSFKVEQGEFRKEFSRDYESNLVGLEANVKKLVGYFVEEDKVQVVSITGMGGLGKTTLARQVLNHADVKRQFDGLAWVCVSQDFTLKNVWQKILRDLKPNEEEKKILEMTESKLQDELIGLLETSKSLIVLDDIWKEEDWKSIKRIFHPSNKDWKVLLTSRNESIAGPRNTTYINLKPECLTTEDSWTLFQRIALPVKDASQFKIDEEMEEMGKQMIKHCGGLPLAIKVLGGLLAAKYTLHDWKRLSENIGSHLVGGRSDFNDDNNNSCNYVLSQSFEELPSYLKHCFLFLAHFPEDHKIEVEKLYYYWAAEGIFEPRPYDGETIKDVGDVYIEELVRRNMVISERESTTLRFETCHLHDMMREICLLKAKEENFLKITSSGLPTANFQSPATSRRVVSQYPTTLHVERDINTPKLRSLVVVVQRDGSWGKSYELSGSSYTRLELLRVLDLCKAKFRGRKLASGIGKLIHLRYLSLEDAEVSHIPSSLGNLKLLIYLNLEITNYFVFVPNVLMGMQELKYLALPRKMHKKTKLELSNLVKLETLKNFSTENSSVEDLRGMVRLRTLTIRLTEKMSTETLSASIGGLRHLEDLRISYTTGLLFSGRSKRRKEEGVVFDFIRLRKLFLDIYMPRQQHFPSRLTLLHLRQCWLEEDPMSILEKLVLLKELRLGFRSFSGRRMVCSSGRFPQLQELSIWRLEELEEWKVEEGSMPLLHTLNIWGCPKLKELPDGLRFISSLKDLIVDWKWKERVSVGGEDYYKVKHIPSIKFQDYRLCSRCSVCVRRIV